MFIHKMFKVAIGGVLLAMSACVGVVADPDPLPVLEIGSVAPVVVVEAGAEASAEASAHEAGPRACWRDDGTPCRPCYVTALDGTRTEIECSCLIEAGDHSRCDAGGSI